ncbi:MAG: polyprenyl synthetase family protein, partial [Polyangiaceae bacterium]|nr:polyprenyl synthetase family protein [Polyangiaceae bacterium]
KSGHHLLAQGGKRLRPMCVALASRVGSGFSPAARELGVAIELVHCATLLHDDVVDIGDQRRGAPSARTLYGNAASIFAGDWLLVDALRRVRAVEVPGTLERLLDIIEEMIFAESIQLENRGRIDTRRESYFQVVDGKTAALFRWAMFAGGRVGGLDDETCAALERYGKHLGVAFQLVDDLLDYAGDSAVTGKGAFADLREGKMTYPLIVAREREPAVTELLEHIVGMPADAQAPVELRNELLEVLARTESLEDCRALALSHADEAAKSLDLLGDSRAKRALLTVAKATVHREF